MHEDPHDPTLSGEAELDITDFDEEFDEDFEEEAYEDLEVHDAFTSVESLPSHQKFPASS